MAESDFGMRYCLKCTLYASVSIKKLWKNSCFIKYGFRTAICFVKLCIIKDLLTQSQNDSNGHILFATQSIVFMINVHTEKKT